MAPSDATATDDFPDGYLWLEPDDAWSRMYEEYEPLGAAAPFFGQRETTPNSDYSDCFHGRVWNVVGSATSTTVLIRPAVKTQGNHYEDRLFAYTLGSGDSEQRVVQTPVIFDSPDAPTRDRDRTVYEVTGFRTLRSGETPVLYPKADVAADLGGTEEYREYVDAVSFWCKWDADDLTTNLGTGEFALGFRCENAVGTTNHLYSYYTLPPGGHLTGSRSETEVRSWHPDETRWMFAEWQDRYDVERAGTREGTDRMNRSKIRGVRTVYNSAQYKVPSIRTTDNAVRWALGFVYIVTASVVLQYYFDAPSPTRLAGSVLAVVGLLMLGVWTHQAPVTPATRLLFWFQNRIQSIREWRPRDL